MEDLISVIVPVYKVEEYLPNCLETIINQTYKNLEIILVDDGSPDKCPEICDQFMQKDTRIKVIHKENGGLSDARNAGIKIATGKYIGFVDSDDYIDPEFYEILYQNILKYDADLAVCNYVETEKSNWHEAKKDDRIIEFNNIEALEALYSNDTQMQKAMVVAWNKLYKREIFEQIQYPVGKTNEDEFVIHHILYKSKKIVYSANELYYYLQRADSIMSRGEKEYDVKRFNQQEAYEKRIQFFYDKNLILLCHKAVMVYLDRIFVDYGMAYRRKASNEIKNRLLENYKRIYKDSKFKVSFSVKQKLKYSIFYHFPNLIQLIIK